MRYLLQITNKHKIIAIKHILTIRHLLYETVQLMQQESYAVQIWNVEICQATMTIQDIQKAPHREGLSITTR